MRKFREEGEAEVGADATGPVKKAAAEAAERRFLFNHRVTRTLSYRVSAMCYLPRTRVRTLGVYNMLATAQCS